MAAEPMQLRDWLESATQLLGALGAGGASGWLIGRRGRTATARRDEATAEKVSAEARRIDWQMFHDEIARLRALIKSLDDKVDEARATADRANARADDCEHREKAVRADLRKALARISKLESRAKRRDAETAADAADPETE